MIKKDAISISNQDNGYKIIIWTIIGIGIALRLFHYFNDRSLWEDEIYLSTGIVKLSLSGLLHQSLDFQQKAPIGYLLIVKVCTLLFGNNEMGLRLFPLLCGIGSLFVFLPVARFFLKPAGVIVSLIILAFAPPLVYHAVEAKQYCTELSATILLLYSYTLYQDKKDLKSIILWGIWGAIIVWFSYSSVFILAGMACVLGFYYLKEKQWNVLFKLAIAFVLWFGSFAVNYIVFTQKSAHTGWLVYFFIKHDAFIPLSGAALPWLLHKLFAFYNYPLGLSWFISYHNIGLQILQRMAWVPLIFTITGVYYLFKRNKRLLLLIGSTFLIVFVASAIKLYPFHERLTVFLAPLFILLIAAGCQFLFRRDTKNIVQYILVSLLLFGPVVNSFAQIIHTNLFGDYKKAYHREAFDYLNKHYQPGDMVYVYWNDLPAYDFYKLIDSMKFKAIEGTDYRYTSHNFNEYFSKLDNEFKTFEGHKRVWILHNNNFDIEIGDYIGHPEWYYLKDDGVKRLDNWLATKGKVVEEFKVDNGGISNVRVMLMDFSK